MKTTFFAVRNGFRADGFLVVGKQLFVARSGRNVSDIPASAMEEDARKERADSRHFGFLDEKGDIPPGEYLIGKGVVIRTDNFKTMAPRGAVAKASSPYKKFPILPTSSTRQGTGIGIRDARHADPTRTDLLFHYDGDVQGSAGCIVYDDLATQDALEAAVKANHMGVEVIHVADARTAKSRADQLVAERNAAPLR